MQIKKFFAALTSGLLLMSLFANVPVSLAALNEPTLLKDIAPGTQDFDPYNFVEFNGNAYFISDGESGDGIRSKIYYVPLNDIGGEVQILGEDVDYFYPSELVVSGDIMYFEADSEGFGDELWAYDGDEVYMVKEISAGTAGTELELIDSDVSSLTVGDLFYFVAREDGSGDQLWVTDGTENGTNILTNLPSEDGPQVNNLVLFNDAVYFVGSTYNDETFQRIEYIYKVDYTEGTPTGSTQLVSMMDFDSESNASEFGDFQVLDGKLYFISSTENCCNSQLYTFDGTDITRPFEMESGYDISSFRVSGDVLYFVSNAGLEYSDGEGTLYYYANLGEELWYYNPTDLAGPVWGNPSLTSYVSTTSPYNIDGAPRPELVEDINDENGSDPNELTAFQNGVIFYAFTEALGREPYYATSDGATLIQDINNGNNSSYEGDDFYVMNNVAYFSVYSADFFAGDDDVLFYTEGVMGTTGALLFEDNPVSASNEVTTANYFFFNTDDLFPELGDEPAVVQYTEGPVISLLTDANSYGKGSDGACYNYDKYFSVVETGKAYFCTLDSEIWETDGTTEGTIKITDYAPGIQQFYVHKDYAYIYYYDNESGTNKMRALDLSDPESGLALVTFEEEFSNVQNVKVSGDILYMTAYTETYGTELFKIDITETPTELELVKDIYIGTNGSNPSDFAIGEAGEIFFAAEYNDGDYYNKELIKSDGTPEGTVMVQDIFPGSDGSYPYNLSYINDKLFFVANDGTSGFEPWVYDGVSTYMLSSLNEGENGSSVYTFVDYNDKVVFASSHDGDKLYITSGVQEDVTIIKESSFSEYDDFGVIGNKLLFDFASEENGRELWVTDGTSENTELLVDIRPGTASSGPGDFYVIGDYMYFEANNGETGSELFITDGTVDGTQLIEDIYPGSFTDYEYDEVFTNYNASSPIEFARLGDRLLFLAKNAETDYEPYVMDVDPTVTPVVEPTSTPTRSGGGSGSRASKASEGDSSGATSYADEVKAVLEAKVVTENPDALTNKCEALVMMQRVFNWNVPAASETKYNDVPEWCVDVAAFGTTRGIVEGRDVDRLGMETPVTRDEVALMIYRELKLQKYEFKGTAEVTFTDAPLTPWASEAIMTLAKEGVIKGFSDGTFGGRKNILKQDLAIMLLRHKKKSINYTNVEDTSSRM